MNTRDAVRHTQHSRSAQTQIACEHCGLPVPTDSLQAAAAQRFCCHGCETAHGIIHGCGLERYYALLQESTNGHESTRSATAPNATSSRSSARTSEYCEFDDPVFRHLYCQTPAPGQVRTEFLLAGVHCGACLWLLERLPRVRPGVLEARLNLRRAALTVTIDESRTTLAQVAQSLAKLGYPPYPSRGNAARDARSKQDRAMLVRIAVAGACAGNIMLLYFALYAGLFTGIEHAHEQLLRYSAMLLNTLCLAWPANIFVRSAWAAVRTRSVHMDVPIALGLYLGGIWGIWKTVAGDGDLYFDSISALVFFLLVGRFLQQRQTRWASDAIELLFSATPLSAHKQQDDGSIHHVSVESLSPDDHVVVYSGDCVPTDGVVVTGASSVDASMLTGESFPIKVRVGDVVLAGTTNLSSELVVRVTATGGQTRAGMLMKLVADTSQQRAPVVMLADRWGKWLLIALLVLAAITIAVWWSAGPAVAIDRAAALLIATCPCGLGLATPLAMTIALGRAAKTGLLIKGGASLQLLGTRCQAGRRVVLLDKTGTLTTGQLSVMHVLGDRHWASRAADLERACSHPVARAIARDLAAPQTASPMPDLQSEHVQGMGVRGIINGCHVLVGNHAMLEQDGTALAPDLQEQRATNAHLTAAYVAVDGVHVATILLGDPLRHDSAQAVSALHLRGWDVRVLSGDAPQVVTCAAQRVGIDPRLCIGGALPTDKLSHVQELLKDPSVSQVVMVGDGVNDAAALAAATVGIAVRGGAQASLAAADISLASEGLMPILRVLDIAEGAMRAIRLTIAASLAYNAIAATLALTGVISPLIAAIIMPASSLTVLGIAWCQRSRRRS